MNSTRAILDETLDALMQEPSISVIDPLSKQLAPLYDQAVASRRLRAFQKECRGHPLAVVLDGDPFVHRAYTKPRGYAGDATMLDYIYRPQDGSMSRVVSVIHEATTTLPNAESIVFRANYLAGLIQRSMTRADDAVVLSVAAGHMRELDILQRLTGAKNVRFAALDHDQTSLTEIRNSYPNYRIEEHHASYTAIVKGLFKREFDLIYSAGLFDYLDDDAAVALIRAMPTLLKAGGMISIGNFARDSYGRGFMAGFMNWRLVYRNEEDLLALAHAACPDLPLRIFRDDPGNVVYLELYSE